jgi:outer membrane protein OmpA-like peptidoglycan-associated protein
MRSLSTLVLGLVLGGAPLAAQHAGQFELGLYGGYTRYDKAFALSSKIGGGARIGYFLGERLELEGDVLFQPEYSVGGSTLQPLIGGASLVLNLLGGEHHLLYLLGGYSRLDFGTIPPYKFTDGGIHGGVGERLFLSHRLALRIEGRNIYTPSTTSTFGPTHASHLVGSVGFSIFDRGTPPKDSDGDRVADKKDACPNTPAGATVDGRGCPSDADGDVVYDGIDKCPATPPGATVDATGCPSDGDKDGVYDGIDKCPDTPPGVTIDPKGCPVDSDGDGVDDVTDKCPGTPAGATVDPTGCPIDSDHDAVYDGLDKCPATPPGATVDVTGCPADADKDGVFDGIDKCPDTPPGTAVDAAGCPPVDTDGDGVVDTADRCPGTPAGTAVDATGCPLAKDSDGDGVDDRMDRCPNTPANTPVDQYGCVILFREERAVPAQPGQPAAPAPRPTLILKGVNFRTGSSALTTESYAQLDQVAGALVANPDVRIEIAGYTDNTGSAVVNTRLSQARALAVRAYLARKGVSPVRMLARGFGPGSPIATNTTVAGRAQNRRVELHKLP